MTQWKAISIMMIGRPLGVIEADNEETARRLAREMLGPTPAVDTCPRCGGKIVDQGIDVREIEKEG